MENLAVFSLGCQCYFGCAITPYSNLNVIYCSNKCTYKTI